MDGTGTDVDPFLVTDWVDLDLIGTGGYTLSSYYKQIDDIDASPSADPGYESGNGWLPSAITGEYNGDGYEITDLYIDRPSTDNIGFTSGVAGSLRNIKLVDCNITGQDYVAGLCGQENAKRITQCEVSGTITGRDCVGGICGSFNHNTVDYCTVTATIIGTGNYVGGISGKQGREGISEHLIFTGLSVTGIDNVGGLFGNLENYYTLGYTQDCQVETDVNGGTNVGGIVGSGSSTGVYSCSYTGDVNGTANVGGVMGYSRECSFSKNTATGTATGTGDYVGGCVGNFDRGGTIYDTLIDDIIVTGNDYVAGLLGASTNYYGVNETVRCGVGNGVVVNGRDKVGGLFGYLVSSPVTKSYSEATVNGRHMVGGLIGHIYSESSVQECYSIGTVTGTNYVGGLAGLVSRNDYWGETTIKNCYSWSNVIGVDKVGGFAGHVYYNSLEKVYSKGLVTGTTNTGGLVGSQDGTPDSFGCYWDQQASKQLTSAMGAAKFRAEMEIEETFLGYDWELIWCMPHDND